jgi:integrase
MDAKMPKLAKPLTPTQVESAKPREKTYTLADGGGMYLEVTPTGKKFWRMSYRQTNGKNTRLTFGRYPETSLSVARQKCLEARKQRAAGIDPAQARRIEKEALAFALANTFEGVAREWHTSRLSTWSERTAKNILRRLEIDIFPLLGARPISSISSPVALDVLKKIEKRGAIEVAKRQGQVMGQIFRYAIVTGRAELDPMPSLRGALLPSSNGHHAAITPAELPEFLLALETNEVRMYPLTRILMRLMLLTFVRTSELTETPWSEIDLENEVWDIPWQRMKMGKKKVRPRKVDHHVFLPKQGWELLRELKKYTGGTSFLFPNQRDHTRPISNGAILSALKRMGYRGRHTGHGFRALAMCVLKEQLNYRHDVVNRQLAHLSDDAYGEAYDRATYFDERRVMMQKYADYLDEIAIKARN